MVNIYSRVIHLRIPRTTRVYNLLVAGSLVGKVTSALLVANLPVKLLVFNSAVTLALMELASMPADILVVGMA
jgi:hypothetical protein